MYILPRATLLALFLAVLAGLAAGTLVRHLWHDQVLAVLASAAAIVLADAVITLLMRRFGIATEE
ncbi:MAG: hypothetical protein PHP59_00885 [Methanofollis sp.]|uniref:hypothetical protein n=1 Tax=Methanofollis sp. TaxID=2052835 RepID=UPI00261B195E|nr:hypothetical protein [Methanofollis sp.]MDD4253916.1 hypothetical protein [Methanofollis sp.]